MNATVTVGTIRIKTYPEPAAEDLPIYAENRVHQRSSGRPYPNKIVLNVERSESLMREYTVVRLENDFLAVEILPDIGGRIFSALDKTTGYDFFYRQHVIKPALIGVLGSWISGGVEFNWPFHHRASGFMPCDFTTETFEDGSVACHLSEHDPIDRMKGRFSVILRPDASYLETRMSLCNRTETRRSFLWWENAAVPVNENYRLFFPKDVTYANFHYLKSRTAFPIADACVYNGIPIADSTDLSYHRNTRDATSYFSAASKYDFFGGYDEGRGCGVVHIADHHIAPGKKMFTWGYNQLSRSWERALTDTDGAYAELMAGAYSDNQPNFSWLEAYETKEFSQFWFPIAKIGCPDFANLDGAMSLDRAAGKVRLLFTRDFGIVTVTVREGDKILSEQVVEAKTAAPSEISVPALAEHRLVAVSVVADGRPILSYAESEPACIKVPEPIEDTPRPEQIADVQTLYLAGVHVDQYRDPAVGGDAYWKAALEKDPRHIPSLVAMARFAYRACRYEEALSYTETARTALTVFNERPESGELFYLRGLILRALGRIDEAYDAFRKAAWDGNCVSRAMTEAATIDLARGAYETALADAQTALDHGAKNPLAAVCKLIALKKCGRAREAEALAASTVRADPFCYTLRFAAGEEPESVFRMMRSDPTQTVLDTVWEFEKAGLREESLRLLRALRSYLGQKSPAILFLTLSYLSGDDSLLTAAEEAPLGRTYPNRAEEFALLDSLAEKSGLASFLLGCIAYAKGHYDKAKIAWERVNTVRFPRRDVVLRGLAMIAFNHSDRREDALPLMKKALALSPSERHTQLLYETVILLDQSGASAEEKRALLQGDPAAATRDDLVTETAKALNQASRPEEALAVLGAHDFTPCEGGEHAIADQYMFAHYLLARRESDRGNHRGAIDLFRAVQTLPEHLGAGIWNRCKYVPYRFGEALCLRALGETEPSDKILREIADVRIDYFSNMHLRELPVYQAECLRLLGRGEDGDRLIEEYETIWKKALTARDGGFFSTTPFFLPFVGRAEELRTAQFSYLLALAARYRGEAERAEKLFKKAYRLNTELLFAGCFGGEIR